MEAIEGNEGKKRARSNAAGQQADDHVRYQPIGERPVFEVVFGRNEGGVAFEGVPDRQLDGRQTYRAVVGDEARWFLVEIGADGELETQDVTEAMAPIVLKEMATARLHEAAVGAERSEELRQWDRVEKRRTEPGRMMPPAEREPRIRIEARLRNLEKIPDQKLPIEVELGDERRPLRDPGGNMILSRARATDVFALMVRSKTLEPEWAHAARRFNSDFAMAQFDPLRAAKIGRIGSGGKPAEMSESVLQAKNAVHAALKKLGGRQSPSASIVWSVAGEGMSVKDWAARQGWGGKGGGGPRQAVAVGILVAALSTLTIHYDEIDEGARRREAQRHSSGSI